MVETEQKDWYVRSDAGSVYGPASLSSLVQWAEDGRVEPSSFVSKDRIEWVPAQLLEELQMKWLVETEPGKVYGPFNRAVVIRLFKGEDAPVGAKVYRLHEFAVDEDEPPRIVEKEVRVEVPVEVEKIVERVVEKIVEVPVEKIVEKIVEVETPARTALVVPEVVEPVDVAPPVRSPGALFKGLDREHLQALESAARAELSRGQRRGFGGFFGGRK